MLYANNNDPAHDQLSEWCEELGQSLLLRHPKNRPPDGGSGGAKTGTSPGSMHPQMHKPMPPMHPGPVCSAVSPENETVGGDADDICSGAALCDLELITTSPTRPSLGESI
ncbi:hypothetical protein PoB_004998100 [Plakobranchus ocellatus]|uniref:Uncharacterized protein n=1 Tax=Plakobranchus ocellatus TaxID=259542 RepID=A0AAV4BWJ4_9GAST|nr:hypothetical protein PoB_004998100 [Plakobranchus ocellatus]